MKNLVFITFFAVMVWGCASAGHNFDSRKVAAIEKGKTTDPQLVAAFGQPVQRGLNSDKGATMTWVYTEASVKGATFIPLVGAFAGGMDTKTKVLTVFLDTNGVVSSYDYSGGGFEARQGTQSDPEATNRVSTAAPSRR